PTFLPKKIEELREAGATSLNTSPLRTGPRPPPLLRILTHEILMITILGAGGAIGNQLVTLLAAKNQPFRLVGRNPKATSGATETLAADLKDRDQTVRAVAGSSVVHLLAGLKYDHKLWEEMWPRVISNAIEACKRARAKLLFFDNVYMYG